MSEHDMLLVLAAAYDNLSDAELDYEAVKLLYYEVETSHDFDAAVVVRDGTGKLQVVRKHEQPTRHGAAHGLGRGLAIGSKEVDANADELARQLHEAQAGS